MLAAALITVISITCCPSAAMTSLPRLTHGTNKVTHVRLLHTAHFVGNKNKTTPSGCHMPVKAPRLFVVDVEGVRMFT